MARMISPKATMRQKVSLRRIRRRSTIRSASSDIVCSFLLLPARGEIGMRGRHRVPRSTATLRIAERPLTRTAWQADLRGEVCLVLRVHVFFLGLLTLALERGAENVAECCAGIRRAILRDGFLLLGDFQGLDRHRDLVGAAIGLD